MTSINRDSHQVQIYVASAILLSLATVGVALRLLARRISSAKLWWDDYTIVIALVCSTFPEPALLSLTKVKG